MSSNPPGSTLSSNAQDLPLWGSPKDAEGPLSSLSSDRYIHENLSDPLGGLHGNIKSPDPLEACHPRKHEYPTQDLQSHVPRYMPEIPEILTNPYTLPTSLELNPEIPKAARSLDLQYARTSRGNEITMLRGGNASVNSPMPKLEQNLHMQRDDDSTVQEFESITSLASAVNAVVLIQRCIKHRSPARIPLILPVFMAVGPRSMQDRCHRSSVSDDFEPHSLLSASERESDDIETNSVDSFDDDFTNSSLDEQNLDCEYSLLRLQVGRSRDALTAFRSTLDQHPEDAASQLANQISSLFDAWLRCLAILQHTGRQKSSSNAQRLPSKSLDATLLTGRSERRPNDVGEDDSSPPGGGSNGSEEISGVSSEALKNRWACPFYQRDPLYYCMEQEFGDYRSCSKRHGFTEVHRVKAHLIQCHTAIYCLRCYSQFKSKSELKAHHEHASRCDVGPRPLLEGLDDDQRNLLKPRDRNDSQEERWKTIYRICFPLDPSIPSPCESSSNSFPTSRPHEYFLIYYTPPETPFYAHEVITIVGNLLSIDYSGRDNFLQQLETHLNTRDPRLALGLSHMLPLASSSSTSHPSESISDSTPPQWQPMQLPQQNSRAVGENQDDRFMTDPSSISAAGGDDGFSYSTPGSTYVVHRTTYGSRHTDGSDRQTY